MAVLFYVFAKLLDNIAFSFALFGIKDNIVSSCGNPPPGTLINRPFNQSTGRCDIKIKTNVMSIIQLDARLNDPDVQLVCASIAIQNDQSTATTELRHKKKRIASLKTIFETIKILFVNFLRVFQDKIVFLKIRKINFLRFAICIVFQLFRGN